MESRSISQYLEKYATKEAHCISLSYFTELVFDRTCVIPLRKESWVDILRLIDRIETLAQQHSHSILLILVVNDTQESTFPEYAFYLAHLRQKTQSIQSNIYLEKRSSNLTLLWIDRFQAHAFSEKEGVGLARKIGCDVVTRLFEAGVVQDPWIRTTDGDAILPDEYFNPFLDALGTCLVGSAIHFSFSHDTSSFEGAEALTLYEIFLRYYFLGLLWSGSCFAYPSIGSCLAIHQDAYVAVRGFPERIAGEDFHLLNKLRKQGPVHYLRRPVVSLKGRFSERVPFGTGKATRDIYDQLTEGRPFTLYHPQVFQVLKRLLLTVNDLFHVPEQHFKPSLATQITKLNQTHPNMELVLQKLKIPSFIESSFFSRRSVEQKHSHFRSLFDGLQTLRFIRALGDSCFPELNWQEALNQSLFISQSGIIRSPKEGLFVVIREEEKQFNFSAGAFSA